MERAVPDGADMTLDTFKNVLDFLRVHGLCRPAILISGGEPTEHRDFDGMMRLLIDYLKTYRCFEVITFMTNGEQMEKDPERFQRYADEIQQYAKLLVQVSADKRYYPRRVEPHKKIFQQEWVAFADDCVERIYPQGRALDNNMPWEAMASKCFNVRAISKQCPDFDLKNIEKILLYNGRFCTPSIGINGEIKLGESELCPACASIYDEYEEIAPKIRAFQCHWCDQINDRLPKRYRKFVE
jgi:organic radical activating enzyme